MSVVVLDTALEHLVDPNARADKIASGYTFTEGPVWDRRSRTLYFSDIYGDTLHRWSESDGARPYRHPSGQANGNTFDSAGRLLTCEHANRRLTRTAADGAVDVVASHYDGNRLNSPNDVICLPDGTVYFTDPPYGLRQPDGSIAGQEQPCNGVYRVSPDGALSRVADDFDRPNGLVVSNDGRGIYVADTQRQHVRVFDVVADGSLQDGRLFVELRYEGSSPRPDGMKMDVDGNLYIAANTRDGIWVYSPEGRLLGFLGLDEPPANLAWGGDEWKTLFVTAQTSVYRLPMRVSGQAVGPPYVP